MRILLPTLLLSTTTLLVPVLMAEETLSVTDKTATATTQVEGPTLITSQTLSMEGSETQNFFLFEGNVVVQSPDLNLTCERLEVTSARGGDPEATIGELGAIQLIVAKGSVHILQAGREAFAGQAVLNPTAGTLVLDEDPKLIDGETEVTGWRILLDRDKRLRVLQDPEAPAKERQRATVTLGGEMPTFNFNREEEPPAEEQPNPSLENDDGWVESLTPTDAATEDGPPSP